MSRESSWRALPWLGIGQRWNGPQDAIRLRFLGAPIAYLEPALPLDLTAIPPGVPLLAHSSELAVATTDVLNPMMLATLTAQVRAIGSPWAGEHFCLTSTIPAGELGYNFAPPLDDETIAATAAHVEEIRDAYGCPVALEAGLRYFGWGDRWDDHAAILAVAERCDCAIILDLSHHLCSMLNLRRTPTDGLSAGVLARTIEIHVTGIGRHATPGFFHDSHTTPVSEEVWSLLAWTLDRTGALRAVTLEHDARLAEADYERDLARLDELVARRGTA